MKKLLLMVFTCAVALGLYAQNAMRSNVQSSFSERQTHITDAQALDVGFSFMRTNGHGRGNVSKQSMRLVYTGTAIDGSDCYYVFSLQPRGFVIVAADERAEPILGYSYDNPFSVDGMPDNVRYWLNHYVQQIKAAVDNGDQPSAEIAERWTLLKSGQTMPTRSVTAVSPLIQTTWDQNQYYNQFCPADANGPGGHVYAGCVATAMAQIIRYWQWPNQGFNSHSYVHNNYGTLSVDYNTATYNYSNMPNSLSSSSSSTQIAEVAKLIYHCGVAVDMDYTVGGSSAYFYPVVSALSDYFAFKDNGTYVFKSNYSDTEWSNMLKQELDNARPIFYSGQGTGGHAFVCDGYDNNGNFHFNWGWSGSYNDGYYALDALTPGAHNYSNDQEAIIGISVTGSFIRCSTSQMVLNVSGNGESEPQTLSVRGRSLSGNINVTVGGGFKISTNGTNYSTSATLASTGGTLYVKYIPTSSNTTEYTMTLTSGSCSASVTLYGSTLTEPCVAPKNLVGTRNGTSVNLQWSEPVTYGNGSPASAVLSWDTNSAISSYYGYQVLSQCMAQRFESSDLTPYNQYLLKSVSFIGSPYATSYSVVVFKGGSYSDGSFNSGEQVVNQVVPMSTVNTNGWNTVFLNNAVLVDASSELWFGVVATGDYVIPYIEDEAVPNKGNVLGFTFDEGDTEFYWNNFYFSNIPLKGTVEKMSAQVLQYDVYRQNMLIGSTANMSYTDNSPLNISCPYTVSAVWNNGCSESATVTVSAPAYTLPTVTTNSVSDIGVDIATCGGNVTSDGGASVTGRGVCWSTSPNPTVSNNHTTDGSGTGSFTSGMTGLTPNTTYYVRAYATNSVGTAYGAQVSFTTEAAGPMPIPNYVIYPNHNCAAPYDGSIMLLDIPADYSYALFSDENRLNPVGFDELAGNHVYWVLIITNYGYETFFDIYVPDEITYPEFNNEITVVASTYCTNDNGGIYIAPEAGFSYYVFNDEGSEIQYPYQNLMAGDYYVIKENNSTFCYVDRLITVQMSSSELSFTVTTIPNTNCVAPYNGKLSFSKQNVYFVVTDSDGETVYEGYSATVQGLAPGRYYVYGTDMVTGCQRTVTVMLTNNTSNIDVFSTVTPNHACVEDLYDGTISVYATGGSGVFEYSFNGGEYVPHNFWSSLAPGIYNIATRDLQSGCETIIDVIVPTEDNCVPVLDVDNRSFCLNERNATLTANATSDCGDDFTYRWHGDCHDVYFEGATIPVATDQVMCCSYSVTATSVATGCEVAENVMVSVNAVEPTVKTKSVTNIAIHTASCGGNVTSSGCSSVTARGVCWSTAQYPTTADAHTSDGAGTGTFTSMLTGLEPGTTYYVRAYATSGVGTAYGNELVFTTNSCSDITLPYTENFDGYTTSTTSATGVEPDCWELVQRDVTMTNANRPQLCYNSNFAHSGNYSLKLYHRGVYAMPELEEGLSIRQVKLEMYLRQASANYRLQVGVWEEDGTFVPVATFNNSTTGVEYVTCDFSGYRGRGGRIAFRNILGSGTTAASSNYLDDIILTKLADCSVSLPYTENFDNYTTVIATETGVEPDCWEVVTEDVALTNATRPQLYRGFSTSGDYSLRLKNRCVYAMPGLAEDVNVNKLTLTFKLRQASAVYRLQVGVVEENGAFTVVKTINNATSDMEDVVVKFSSYTGSGKRIAFRNTVKSSSTLAYSTNYIDDIVLGYACDIVELPYAENFDSYTTETATETGVEPDCWEVVTEDVALTNATKPQLYHGFSTSGDYSLRLKNRCVYAMPALGEGIDIKGLEMSFKLRQANAVYRLQVGVVEENGAFTVVKTINNATTDMEDVVVKFSGYTGSGKRIAFRNTVKSGSTLAYSTNYIDDIVLGYTCDIVELPYTENFDSYTTVTATETGVEPDCWEVVTEDVALTNATKPQLYRGFSTSGDYSLRLKNRCVYAMPEFAEGVNVKELTMTFKLRQANAVYRLQVGVVEENGAFTAVKTINNATTDMEDVTVSFSGYTGSGRRIAFRNTVKSSSTLAYSTNYIDDINITRTATAKSAEVTDANASMLGAEREMLDVVVYPNPTKDVVNVQCTMNNVQCSGIEVVDIYGKIITTVGTRFIASAQSPVQIDVSGLTAGMYFVRVTTDRGVVTKPFVKR